MITLDKQKLIEIEKLNKAERVAFRLFLLHERDRHREDIVNINKTLRELK